MKKITIVVVDDHKLIREMFVELFFNHKNIKVVGESGGFDDAVEMIKAKKPDIALLDINLPPFFGLDAVPLIREFSPNTRIIGVSMHCQPLYAKNMIKSGGKGYVTKNSSTLEIFNAIEQVMNGKVYLCNEIKDALSNQLLLPESKKPNLSNLTSRQLQIIKLIKKGCTSKEIAVNNKISVKTVEVHRYNILKRLRMKNTASLINFVNSEEQMFSFS